MSISEEVRRIGEVRQRMFTGADADVAPVVHGRWESIEYYTTVDGKHRHCYAKKCSVCRRAVPRRSEYAFCPICGAHMKDGDGNG